MRSETRVIIYGPGGAVLQTIRFHTSCSHPLLHGALFSGIQLTGFADKSGGGASQ